MESYRLSGSSDVQMQRGYGLQHSPSASSQENLFGVRVQVQGIKGQPYVVLNTAGQESHKDVSVITHQAGYNPGTVRRSVDETQRRPNSSGNNYQSHSEMLRPYEAENNNYNHSRSRHAGTAQTAKPRIPLPAEGPAEEPADLNSNHMLEGHSAPLSPSSVDTDSIVSVGRLISQFNSSLQRGRGPRNRLDPEACRRSRSVDSSRTSSSSSSSSLSSRASSLKGAGGDAPAGIYPPGSARARLLGGECARTSRGEESRLSKETVAPSHRAEKPPFSRPAAHQTAESEERDAQQELSADPPEEATKQILFTCLKNGTTDDDPTTQRKVKLLLNNISKLKWKTVESVEEEEKATATGINALQEKQAALEKEVSHLKQKLDIEIKNEMTLAKAFEKARSEKKVLQEELNKSQTELRKLREKLAEIEEELRSTKQELTQMRTERERSKVEMKDLQQQLSEMHDELDRAKKVDVINTEKEVLLQDLAQLRVDFQEMLQAKEEQEEVLHHRERELSALKGALKEEVETHDKYIAALKEEYELELERLLSDLELAKESNTYLGQEKAQVEEERGAAKVQLRELIQERDNLKGKVRELSNKVEQLNQAVQEFKTSEKMMEQRTKQLEREKNQVEEMLEDVRRSEEELCQSNQSLLSRLEDVQGKLGKLNHEHKDLKEKLKEERKQVEELWKIKAELEDEKRMQDRAMEQLQRKMNTIMEECEASTDVLQNQVDEARERSQRELTELRRQLQEKGAELEKSRQAAKKLQEELLPLEEDLRRCRREQQEAQLRGRQLEQRAEELEERNAGVLEERERQIKLMEERTRRLEEDLGDERSSSDRLMERLDKTKEQAGFFFQQTFLF
ncbi:cingulin-like isoform 1-T1 [Fundulus diaphanus]